MLPHDQRPELGVADDDPYDTVKDIAWAIMFILALILAFYGRPILDMLTLAGR